MTLILDIGKHDIGISHGKVENGGYMIGIYFLFFEVSFYSRDFIHYTAMLKKSMRK